MAAVSETLVPGVALTRPEWLGERIADMGISWGTGNSRVSGTLWWCMAASSLVDPIATAYAENRPAPDPQLERLVCEVRPDGGIERVFPDPAAPARTAQPVESRCTADELASAEQSCAAADSTGATPGTPAPETVTPAPETSTVGATLRETLGRIIPVVAEVSGAGVPSLWAIVADAIGNRALDAGAPEAGTRLAAEVAGQLPVPRFTDAGGRTFVRRISCCLVYEVSGCQMCTSCPKRPAAQRLELLTALATRG
ncbi:(2Fe-2S)-binding protein [Nocardia sp. BMG111209]|uniref:(2Fe-2S)-binding protein n=1 Tax=Nocardia sp. BMG111209 TaxID=1160137 RepID=UPI0012DF50BD